MLRVMVFFAVSLLAISSFAADFYVIPSGKRAVRTILVSPKATAEASGAALLAVIDDIDDNSADNPCLVLLEPGVYDIGANSLQMKAFVDVQGAGPEVSFLKGAPEAGASKDEGIVKAANDCAIRDLSIVSVGGGLQYLTGIACDETAFRAEGIEIDLEGAASVYGAHLRGSAAVLTMDHASIRIGAASTSAFGVLVNDGGSLVMSNFDIDVEYSATSSNYGYGFDITDGDLRLTNGQIKVGGRGENKGIFVGGFNPVTVYARDVEVTVNTPGAKHYAVYATINVDAKFVNCDLESVGVALYLDANIADPSTAFLAHSLATGNYQGIQLGSYCELNLAHNVINGGVHDLPSATDGVCNCAYNVSGTMEDVICP